jgi:Ca2+-transporting ATPase
VVAQFASPLVLILLGALALDITLWLPSPGNDLPVEALAIAAILALNATLGYWQERKAERALRALTALSAPRVWVLRDGTLSQCPALELVPGDLIRVEAGDRVAADGVLLEARDCQADESVLTGESLPLAKSAGDELLAGTMLVRGQGWAEIVRTGGASAMGKIAAMLAEVRREPTPLEQRMAVFGRRVAIAVVLLALVIAAAGIAVEGPGRLLPVLLFAVALAVAAVPEGLPAVLTFALALGVERMARRRAVVRRLDAVESLGAVTVIATDKTGTITENRMEVRDLLTADSDRAIRAMIHVNDAEPGTGAGDPLELALLQYARLRDQDPHTVRAAAPRISDRAFDSAWRFMRVTVTEAGKPVSYLKGAPEELLARCRLSLEDQASWLARSAEGGSHGLRPIGLAWGDGEREDDLQWLGLVMLWDPPRPEVAEAVRQAVGAGVRVVMVTGDHPATAQAIARAVGLPDAPVVTGAELDRLSPEDLARASRTTAVFARVTAEHKLRIVEALKTAGEVVAVTGDGVNDAPALKRADVGIAMGRRGSEVAREVADLVLLDDNFATIIAAIEEGRSIFANIRKVLRFLFSTNLSEVLLVAAGFVAALALDLREAGGGLLLPLIAVQLLWINLVTDGAPALALALDRNPGVLRQPPRSTVAALLDRASLRFIIFSASVKAAIAGLLLVLLPLAGGPPELIRTAVFVFMASGQVVFAYPSRRIRGGVPPNFVLHVAVLVGVLLQPALVLMPWSRTLLGLVPLTSAAWLAVGLGMVTSWLAAELTARALADP